MFVRRWFNRNDNRTSQSISINTNNEENHQSNRNENRRFGDEEILVIYLANNSPCQSIINLIRLINHSDPQIFENENDCLNSIQNIIDKKIFLILDSLPSNNILNTIEFLPQIYSLFIYSSIENLNNDNINQHETSRLLTNIINQSQQTITFNLLKNKEKFTRDLNKESGSFLFFQLFKNVIMNMPKTLQSKEMMLEKCREYYSNNIQELNNIYEFNRNYKSSDAISWYTKESFVYRLVNKALRTEDIDVLYYFRFYIIDLCKQLELKSIELRKKENNILILYRGLKLSLIEINTFKDNINNLISTNGYLSVSRLHSIAYNFSKLPTNRIECVSVIFEYTINLNKIKSIVIADIAQYSDYPQEEEVLIDIGACFRIDSCTFDIDDDLWYIKVHATDEGANIAAEYIEYYKNKIADANIGLMFGHLLIEMGEFLKAEKYFNNILNSSNPNDEEIACIYFNFGRTYRFKGDFNRAIDYYTRAYNLHIKAKPQRLYSAAKTLNGLGLVYREQENLDKALEYFYQALKFYDKSVQRQHIDIASVLINLSSIQCDQEKYNEALNNVRKAIKIYDHCLPSGHPNYALALVSLANIHFNLGDINIALDKYNNALEMQEKALPTDHPDIARTFYNLALVYIQMDNLDEARNYFQQAKDIASRTLSLEHPFMNLIINSTNSLVNNIDQSPSV